MAVHIYCRYSESKTDDTDIEVQIRRGQQYADMHDLREDAEPYHLYRDPAISGGVPVSSRPQGRMMLTLLKKGDHIVVRNLSRLSRDTIEVLTLAKAWQKRGITLHFADEGGCSFNASTPMGWQMLSFLAGAAEAYRMQISITTSAAMLRHQEKGRAMGGTPPYGWTKDGATLIENEEEQQIIEVVVALNNGGYTLRRIADKLDDDGYKSRNGGMFVPSTLAKMIKRKTATGSPKSQ